MVELTFSSIKDKNIHRISEFTSDQNQLLTIKLSLKKYCIICTVGYLSPGLRLIDSMKSLEKYLDGIDVGREKDYVFCGGFNLDYLKPQIKSFYENCLRVFILRQQINLESTSQTVASLS